MSNNGPRCICMPPGFCIWLFIYLFQDLHVYIPAYSHVWVFGFVSLCFSTCLSFLICSCMFAYLCGLAYVCTWPVYKQVYLPVVLCQSPFGFLYEDAIICICLSLEMSNTQLDFRHLSSAWQAKDEIQCWRMVGQALVSESLISDSLWLNNYFLSTWGLQCFPRASSGCLHHMRPPGSPLSPF